MPMVQEFLLIAKGVLKLKNINLKKAVYEPIHGKNAFRIQIYYNFIKRGERIILRFLSFAGHSTL